VRSAVYNVGQAVSDVRRVLPYSIPPYKRWGSVAELTCHLQGSTSYGIRLSHKTYRPSPNKDVTQKDPPLMKGPLIGEYTVFMIAELIGVDGYASERWPGETRVGEEGRELELTCSLEVAMPVGSGQVDLFRAIQKAGSSFREKWLERGGGGGWHLEKGVVVEEEKIFAGFGQEEAVHVILFFMSGHRPQAGPPPWGPVVPVEVVHEDFAVPQIPFISGRLSKDESHP
jgi:hypothetical protein